MSWASLTCRMIGRSLRHPSLGIDLIRVGWRFRRRSWYRRFPFLPLPDRDYLRWRMYTAYGSADAIPPAHDLERYARWAVRH